MRRIMRSYNQKLCGPLSCSSRERVGARPLWLFEPKRSAFTLVELLVVIGILAVVAALITPAIFQARVSARNAAIKAEIDMLHMAIMNYKNEYGSFPPCSGSPAINGETRPVRHLRRLFPRCPDPSVQFGGIAVSPNNALALWLTGFTGDPESPFLPTGNRKKLYDWDMSRVNSTTGEYHPSGKPGSPYIYIDSSVYGTPDGTSPGGYQALAGADAGVAAGLFGNPGTFQILCAGLDEQWGTEDDLSNVWKGTRQDFLDSLE